MVNHSGFSSIASKLLFLWRNESALELQQQLNQLNESERLQVGAALLENLEKTQVKDTGNLFLEPELNYSETFALVPGSICGPFRIEQLIGEGGMGSVYLAVRADDLDLKVALKVVHNWRPDSVALFRRECQILSGLKHPGIAHLVDAGVQPNGQPWLAMEYVEGRTLLEVMKDSAPTLVELLKLFIKICEAMEHAHQQMVIHRY